MTLNLIPFYAEALAHAERIRENIDEVYSKRKEEYYLAAKNSEFYNCKMCTENSLLTEEYFKKCVGILEYAGRNQDESAIENIYDLFKRAYRKTYLYFKNSEPSDMQIYFRDMNNYFKDLDDDAINGNAVAAIFFGGASCKNADKVIDTFRLRWEHYNGYKRVSLDNASAEDIRELDDKYKKVPKNIIKDEMTLSNKRTLSVYDYIYDIEGISSLAIFRELEFSNRDIKEIILAYIASNKCSDSELEMEFDYKYIIPALHIKAMCKAYKKVKEMYFTNNKETMYIEMGALKKEVNQLKSEVSTLEERSKQLTQSESARNMALLQKNNQLQKEINQLNELLIQTRSNTKEIVALREYVFNLSKETLYESLDTANDADLSVLGSVKGMIVGGHDNWQNKIKEYIPSWKMIKAGVNTLDIEVVQNCDVVIFNTGYLNHSLYYKIIDMIRNKKIRIGYVSNTNIQKTLNELIDICKQNPV